MKNGPSAAAMLAGGIGLLVFGVITALSEAIATFGNALVWVKPVGALSGKTTIGLIAWLVAWVVLGMAWKEKEMKISPIIVLSAIGLLAGFLLTFPPVFEWIKGG